MGRPMTLYDIPSAAPVRVEDVEEDSHAATDGGGERRWFRRARVSEPTIRQVPIISSAAVTAAGKSAPKNIYDVPKSNKPLALADGAAASPPKKHLYDMPWNGRSPQDPLPPCPDEEATKEASGSDDDGDSLSNISGKPKEEVKVLSTFRLHKYTIPSFPVIAVKLRHVEIMRPTSSGTSVALDAYFKDHPSLNSQAFPKRVQVFESCIVPVRN